MNIRQMDRLQETLYSEELPNGLKVHVLPKEGFRKTYVTFTTKYGSIDNHFRVEGRGEVRVPDGIAHFLEHKMFEEPDGVDVFAKFSLKGASANAFTSFDRTSYLFSATENIPENVETLLNFVQNPYFTDENVEKEKGIIGQEINMYRDQPDWRVYYGLIEALYREHPVRIDIAGTVDSIGQITKEMLYDCHETFYHPSNMQLFIVGGVDPAEMIRIVKDNQAGKTFGPAPAVTRLLPEEPEGVHAKENRIRLTVAMPKCMFGFKEASHPRDPQALLRRELEMRMVLDLALGPSSELYQTLYEEQLITDSFGSDFISHEGAAFSIIGGDTRDPSRLAERFRELMRGVVERGFRQEDFERCRRKRIGAYLKMFNSPEAIAHEFSKYAFRGMDLFSFLPVYEAMTKEQLEARMREHVDWERFSVCVVESKSG
jgi:predicted Zn-dependent peptidase